MIPTLGVSGGQLIDTASGAVVRLPGVGLFSLFKRFLLSPTGWRDLCEPILLEVRRVATEGGYTGPIVIRVFRCAAPPNAFALDPWSYDFTRVTEFTNLCAGLGFIVDWSGGDFQKVFPSTDPNMGQVNGDHGINQHTNQFCAALAGIFHIFNMCNEPFKNGVDCYKTVPPPWRSAVWYSGVYYGGAWDPSTDGTCINLHTDRGTENNGQTHKWVTKPFESAPYLWPNGKPIFYDEPMGADEKVIDGRRSNVPCYFGVLGLTIGVVSAVYFHSTAGQSCDGMGPDFATVWPITRQCMVHYFRGIVGGLKV